MVFDEAQRIDVGDRVKTDVGGIVICRDPVDLHRIGLPRATRAILELRAGDQMKVVEAAQLEGVIADTADQCRPVPLAGPS